MESIVFSKADDETWLDTGFYINLPPSGAVIAVLAVMRIPENMEKKPVRDNLRTIITELDLLGFALFAPSCIMFLLAMSWGGTTYAWKSAPVIGLFCGAFGTFCVFVAWQIYRGEHAMIPPRIVRDQLVLFGCATSAFQMGALLLLAYYLPLWFQVVKGASPTMSGVMTLPTMISQSLASVIAGRLGTFHCHHWQRAQPHLCNLTLTPSIKSSIHWVYHTVGFIWKCIIGRWCRLDDHLLTLHWCR